MTVASLKLYLAVFLIASICSSVLSNSRRSENGGKQRKEETPFWAARGKRAELAGGIIRCGIVRPSPVESDSEISWPEIEPTGEDDLTGGRVKRSAGSSLKGEIEPVPLWLTRASMEMERPGYQQYFYPYSHNERLMNFLRQLQEKRADRGAEKNANSESAPFWAPRG